MLKGSLVNGMIMLSMITGVYAQSANAVKGKVRDERGNAIPSASVSLLNSNFGTATNKQGEFTFPSVPYGKYVVRISAINFGSITRTITVNGQSPILDLQLNAVDTQLEEVTVTAQKREENSQQLPLSVSTLSARQVNEFKLWNTEELTAIIPNLYAADPGDNRNVTSIRGIATTSYDPAVATYIDGVNQFGLDTYIAQLQDVERIEVLRGPQGTLYGRNAMAGVINIITKQPGNTAQGFAELSFGNYNQQRYTAAFRAPLVKNRLFFGVSGLYTKQNGFYTNSFTASSFDDKHSAIGNYYLKFLANPKLSVTLNAKHLANRNQGTFPLVGSIQDAFNDPFVLSQNNVAGIIDNVFNTSLSVNYSGTRFNFTSQSAYQSNYRYYNQLLDADFSPIDGYAIVNNYGRDWNNVKVASQEFRFSSPAASVSPVKWVAGTYLFSQRNPVKQGTHIGADGALVGAPLNNFTAINTNLSKSYGVAVFGQGAYSLSPKLNLIIGLRYDYEHKKQNILGEFQPDGARRLSPGQTPHQQRVFMPSLRNWGSNTLPASSAISTLRIAGDSVRGVSANYRPTRGKLLVAYKPEFSNNFEIGSKNTFAGRRVSINASLFYTTVNNAQVPTLVLPDAITLTRNAGKLSSKGAELELRLTPAKGLEASYSFGFTDAEYSRLDLSSNGASVNLKNNRQIFTPNVSSMLTLQYGFSFSDAQKMRFTARGEWRFTGKQYFDLANQQSQEGYHLFNTRFGVTAGRVELSGWAANVFDKKYVDYAYDFGAAHLGNPGTYGLSVRTNF